MKRVEDFNEFLSDHVNINQNRLDKLNDHVAAVTTHLSRHLDAFEKVERQGSYALRTIIKPKDNREYDADILLFMKYRQGKKPAEYINDAYNCLRDHGTYRDMVHRKTRCVMVDYAGDFHLDIVPCVEVNGQRHICNNKTNQFEITDGTGYRDWFNRKTQITNGNLKRATRVLKYMRDHKGNFTAPSILLTTLIGMSVQDNEGDTHFKTVPDTLMTVCNRINAFLQANPNQPEIRNPALRQETFTRHWDQNKYRNFREKFDIYTGQVNDAFNETDPQRSVQKWQKLLGEDFGKSVSKSGNGRAPATAAMAPATVTPRKPYSR